jgi:hypothetical protein
MSAKILKYNCKKADCIRKMKGSNAQKEWRRLQNKRVQSQNKDKQNTKRKTATTNSKDVIAE